MTFSVLRVPFFLEPNYDERKAYVGSNRDRLVKKWGGKRGWEAQKLRHDLKGRGLEAGIPHFNLDRLASNSMASHRLIQHVGKKYGLRASEALYDRLNVYYFVDGHALNDRPRLARVASEELEKVLNSSEEDEAAAVAATPPPMTEEEVFAFLNGDEGRAEIEKALLALNQLGVHGIPKFIIEGRTVVDGAARSDSFVQIFRDIERRGSVAGEPIFKDILGISDEVIRKGSHSAANVSQLAA